MLFGYQQLEYSSFLASWNPSFSSRQQQVKTSDDEVTWGKSVVRILGDNGNIIKFNTKHHIKSNTYVQFYRLLSVRTAGVQ